MDWKALQVVTDERILPSLVASMPCETRQPTFSIACSIGAIPLDGRVCGQVFDGFKVSSLRTSLSAQRGFPHCFKGRVFTIWTRYRGFSLFLVSANVVCERPRSRCGERFAGSLGCSLVGSMQSGQPSYSKNTDGKTFRVRV